MWIGALERIHNAGLKRLGAIHRGFSSYDKKIYRNLPQWHIPIELRRRLPNLPIFCDPSHIGGKRELVAPALPAGNGPELRWSDRGKSLQSGLCVERRFSTGNARCTRLHPQLIGDPYETQTTESLSQLRKQIDECDDNIIQELAKRMRVAREIRYLQKRTRNHRSSSRALQ